MEDAPVGKGPGSEVRRWLLELSMAEKRDKDYRECSRKIWERYRGKNRKRNSFNILWANTEILAPAIFNSTPKPDVRRRFKDEDPVGKQAAEVIRRSLEFAVDSEDFDGAIRFDVLDMLLPGRGVSRVRYVPSISQTPRGDVEQGEYDEALAWEQVCVDHVQWDAYRLGPGKTWAEIDWIAFLHRMTREELVEKFGEQGETIPLDDYADDDAKIGDDKNDREVFKTAPVWEIWDKPKKMVRFVSPNDRERFLKEIPDPLELQCFFPIPKPIQAIQDSSCMEPVALFEQYREQAEELNRLSMRVNRIVDALKIRGIYDSTLACLSELMKGDDNDLIPAADAARFTEQGFEKAIWFMPIEQAAKVLQSLYLAREACKQVIYELTGISDILRGATDPNETLGAQEIKAQTGSQRVQQMQRDVARYIRDIMRMMGEIIGQKFQQETLQRMTGVKIPTQADVQMMMMQWQQQAQIAQMQGQQPPPQPEIPVTWEQVMEVLRDDMARQFKIDIETDSTVAASIQQDMAGLRDVLTAVTQFIAGVAPAVQAGAFPVDAVKEIVMTIARRSKMGNAVEDALDKIQEPRPPEAPPMEDPTIQLQHEQQMNQQTLAADKEAQAMKLQAEAQKLQMETEAKLQQAKIEAMRDIEIERAKIDASRSSEQESHARELMMSASQQAHELDLAKLTAMSAREKPEEGETDEGGSRIEAMLQEMEGRRQYRANLVANYLSGPRDATSLQATLAEIRH